MILPNTCVSSTVCRRPYEIVVLFTTCKPSNYLKRAEASGFADFKKGYNFPALFNVRKMLECRALCFRSTIARLIRECKGIRELKQIHSQIIIFSHLSRADYQFLISRLLFFCAISKSGCLSYATGVFNLIGNPNLFEYNVMIRAYACKIACKDSCQSLMHYKQMLREGIAPNCITFPFLLKECARRIDGANGRSTHSHVLKFGFCGDLFSQNSMITLYSECGFLSSAHRVFDEMFNRDVVSWNSMITGCLRGGELDTALYLFRRMEARNNITWNSIITGFVHGGQPTVAIELFHEMQSEDVVKPDKFTVASVLSACANLGALDHGRWVHSYLKRTGLECDAVIGTALVDMYGKCGNVQRAIEVFEEMPTKDVLAWTAMIAVFALHGNGTAAFDIFREMERLGLKPNPVTFTGLLSACAHSGLVEKGRWCFGLIRSVYSIEPQVQHYACMVDILSRAGFFDEAEELIRNMPMKPDVFVWGALLGGCLMHGNVELGEKVALHLIELDPQNHAFYVTLCDIYVKAGRFDDVKRTRAFMNLREIKKTVPGSSMIEVDGIVHIFSVKGSPILEMEEICCVLRNLSNEMKTDVDADNDKDMQITFAKMQSV